MEQARACQLSSGLVFNKQNFQPDPQKTCFEALFAYRKHDLGCYLFKPQINSVSAEILLAVWQLTAPRMYT